LSEGNPEQQVAGHMCLFPEHYAGGIVPVVSWVDALQGSGKMGSLSSQSLWCIETTFLRTVFTYHSAIVSNCG
jgi:hypothetical protein